MPQEPTRHDLVEVVRGFAEHVPSDLDDFVFAWNEAGVVRVEAHHDIAEARRATERLAKEAG